MIFRSRLSINLVSFVAGKLRVGSHRDTPSWRTEQAVMPPQLPRQL